jgi:hypothetical protein
VGGVFQRPVVDLQRKRVHIWRVHGGGVRGARQCRYGDVAAERRRRGLSMRVFLASPCYDAMEPEFVGSLLATLDLLRERGHEAEWGFIKGTLVHKARNTLADEVLSDGADVMVQLDVDHQWRSGDLVAAVECVGAGRLDVVGFAYVLRSRQTLDEDRFASPKLLDEPSPLRAVRHDEVTYVEVAAVGGGILVVSRRCLERMAEDASRDERDGVAMLFKMVEGIGEDVYFCQRWRELGGRVYCHVDAIVAHIGKTAFADSFRASILNQPMKIDETSE